jgi:multisubunit Na+/H+ antiporter MnhG subunit
MNKILAYIKEPRTLQGEYNKLFYVYSRLREPSSHAALAAIFAVFGTNISDQMWNNVINGLSAVFAIAGIFLKEDIKEK